MGPPRLAVALWIALWVSLSVSIILTNKYVLGYTAFRFPFVLALWHMLLASASARTAMKVLAIPDTIRQHGSRTLNMQLAAIGVLFGSALVLGNASFIFLSVPTVQMLKAGGPATIYLIGIALGTESPKLLQATKVLVVCTGVGIASYGDITLNFVGMVLQLGSIVTDALRCCFLQRVLQHSQVDATPLVTLAHVAPYSAAALVLPMAVVEGRRLVSTFGDWQPAIPAVLLSGLLAACLNFVVFKLIRLTSALTTSLSGVIKEWVCILVAMYVYGTVVTNLQWVGYSIAIAGLLWYQSGKLGAASSAVAAGGAAADMDAGSCTEEKVRLKSSTGRTISGGGSNSRGLVVDVESGGKGSVVVPVGGLVAFEYSGNWLAPRQ